jgi:small subunit ribosomal protein S16
MPRLTNPVESRVISGFSGKGTLPYFYRMSLKIRLTRIGSTHQPHYRVVVAETRSRRDGDPVEVLGSYDPRAKGEGVKLNLPRVDYWLGKGAKPSDTIHALIKRNRRSTAAAAAAPAPAPAPATANA